MVVGLVAAGMMDTMVDPLGPLARAHARDYVRVDTVSDLKVGMDAPDDG